MGSGVRSSAPQSQRQAVDGHVYNRLGMHNADRDVDSNIVTKTSASYVRVLVPWQYCVSCC